MTTIASIQALPYSPYNGTGIVGIVITSGVPSYFKIVGSDLADIVSFNWYPKNPGSVLFDTRQLILVDNTEGTIMVRVIDNYLDDRDRGGKLGFRLSDGNMMSFEVKTYGRVSVAPLWQAPEQGLITG
jgi:hypothetical protein